jgi:hypothetical protein
MLQAGASGCLGLSLADLTASQATATETASAATRVSSYGKAKHCIVLFLYGAPSQLDTFDPKPQAPEEIRGPFQSIETALAGVRICEHLPRIARLLHKTTLVRSLTHEFPIHGVAHSLTGIDQVGIPLELNRLDPRHWPTLGSVLEYVDEQDHPRSVRHMPNNVHLPWDLSSRSFPHKRAGNLAGFLGGRYNPVVCEFAGRATRPDSFRPHDPYAGIERDCTFSITSPDEKPVELTLDRLATRRRLVEQFDAARRHLSETRAVEGLERFQQMAYSVIAGSRVQEALDVRREPDAVRQRYGYHLFGQSALVARRLIEAGTRLVTVFWDEFGQSCGAWDTHEQARQRLSTELCPGLDQTFSALIEDLESRGLLDETLVVCMGEHGRTPLPEKRHGLADGRNHWSRAYSGLFAGGGFAQGAVVGQSDAEAAWVKDRPISPKDVLRTIYHLMGVDADRLLRDRLNRPLPLVAGGEVVGEMIQPK